MANERNIVPIRGEAKLPPDLTALINTRAAVHNVAVVSLIRQYIKLGFLIDAVQKQGGQTIITKPDGSEEKLEVVKAEPRKGLSIGFSFKRKPAEVWGLRFPGLLASELQKAGQKYNMDTYQEVVEAMIQVAARADEAITDNNQALTIHESNGKTTKVESLLLN